MSVDKATTQVHAFKQCNVKNGFRFEWQQVTHTSCQRFRGQWCIECWKNGRNLCGTATPSVAHMTSPTHTLACQTFCLSHKRTYTKTGKACDEAGKWHRRRNLTPNRVRVLNVLLDNVRLRLHNIIQVTTSVHKPTKQQQFTTRKQVTPAAHPTSTCGLSSSL